MCQTELVELTMVSRSDGPVWTTRLATRPAKSFWKKLQLWRTTCQCDCQRTRFDRPGTIAWLVTSPCVNCTTGRTTTSVTAIRMSRWRWRANSSPGVLVLASETTRPMK